MEATSLRQVKTDRARGVQVTIESPGGVAQSWKGDEEVGDISEEEYGLSGRQFMEAQSGGVAQDEALGGGAHRGGASGRRPPDDEVKEYFESQGGGPWEGKGTVPRNEDGTVDMEANHARIAKLRDQMQCFTVGTGRHRRFADILLSTDKPEDLRRWHLRDGGMSEADVENVLKKEQWSAQENIREQRFQKERSPHEAEQRSQWPLCAAWEAWEELLEGYPSALTVSVFLDRIHPKGGANVGYWGPRPPGVHEDGGRSTKESQEVVAGECDELKQSHKVAGFWDTPPFVSAFVHRVTAIPKTVDGEVVQDKWRVIHNPRRINALLRPLWCPTITLHHIMDMIFRAGRGCLISKEDDTKAFFSIPVRDEDHHLFGLHLPEQGYGYFNCLTMGSGSSPSLYSLKISLFKWIVKKYVRALHKIEGERCSETEQEAYVDDLVQVHCLKLLAKIVAEEDSLYSTTLEVAQSTMGEIKQLATRLGIVLAKKKSQPPSTTATVLGVVFDTVAFTVTISEARKAAILRQLADIAQRKSVVRVRLEELLGRLIFINQVAPCVKPFLCRLSAAMVKATWAVVKRTRKQWHQVRNTEVFVEVSDVIKDDLLSLHTYLLSWDRTELVLPDTWVQSVSTYCGATAGGDANLKGYGGFYDGYWFSAEWSEDDLALAQREKTLSITFLEALTQLRCVLTFGHLWRGKRILLACDNNGAVAIINKAFTSDCYMANIVRRLAIAGLSFKCDIKAKWIDTKTNKLCDLLSRGFVSQAVNEFKLDKKKRLPVQL